MSKNGEHAIRIKRATFEKRRVFQRKSHNSTLPAYNEWEGVIQEMLMASDEVGGEVSILLELEEAKKWGEGIISPTNTPKKIMVPNSGMLAIICHVW